MRRRALILGTAAALATRSSAAQGDPDEPHVREVDVGGHRATLVVPRHLSHDLRVPLVVLLHGLGETGDARAGARAWVDRYGLVSAYTRLRRPPVEPRSRRGEWTESRLAEVNAALAQRPLRGLVLVCPHMPLLAAGELDRYARFLSEELVPYARREAPVLADDAHTALGGCSLGGSVSLEIFQRNAARFGAWCGVQTAIGEGVAAAHARRLATTLARGARPLSILTSTLDPYRKGNEALARELATRQVPADLRVVPGPHDQPWLREAGTLEMLHWLDTHLRG